MSAASVFSIIKDIFIAGAAGVTAYVAYTGLEKWRQELRGKANFEVARELIKSVYKLRDEISYCRSPFIQAHEFPEGYQDPPLRTPSNEEKGRAYAHVYFKRWEPVAKATQDFDAALLEAEALWGKNIKEKAESFRHCVRILQVDIEDFIYNEFSGGRNFNNNNDFAKKVRSSVSDTKSTDNELTNKINAAIEGLETEIRPHLSRD